MVKVIASSVRKGNVLEVDGHLCSVLSAESFFPGKGTPTTQIDMRRIADGVKVSQRYKTTEQVERAYVEDRDFTYLYQDGEQYVFMNPETYDQLPVDGDVVGDMALGVRRPRRRDRTAAARHPRGCRDRAGDQRPDGLLVLQAGDPLQRRAQRRAAACRRRHPHRGDDGRRLLCRARQGLIAAPADIGGERLISTNAAGPFRARFRW